MKILITAWVFCVLMAFFDGAEQVLKIEGLTLGEFDPSVSGFYKNVKSFSFNVKKRKAITVEIITEVPIDIAVANENGGSVLHKQGIKEEKIGPIPTEDNKLMGIILGIYPGDRTTVNVVVWMEKT
jgi:hypothetical protein